MARRPTRRGTAKNPSSTRRHGGDPRRNGRRSEPLSPIRVGGRALGVLQVPFRTWLDAQDEDETWMSPGDVEARLMESLGWLLLENDLEIVPDSATGFLPEEVRDLLGRIAPAVAEANGLDGRELGEEVATAWEFFLTFLDESGVWSGTGDSLAECLDAVAAGEAGASPNLVLALLGRTAEEVDAATELAFLTTVPAAAQAITDLAGTPAGHDDLEAQRLVGRRSVAGQIALRLDPLSERSAVQAAILSVLVSAVLQNPQDVDGIRTNLTEESGPDAEARATTVLEELRGDQILSGAGPWTADRALAGSLLLVVGVFVEGIHAGDTDVGGTSVGGTRSADQETPSEVSAG